MNRLEFFKTSGFLTVGIFAGLNSSLSLTTHSEKIRKLEMPTETTEIIKINKGEEMWIGWLAKLVIGSLVTALGAKIVDALTNTCYCNETGCYRTDNYKNAVGIYGYNKYAYRFVTQKIEDESVQFDNMSVPFLTSYNSRICNLEGPFLAGICWATNDLLKKYDNQLVRKVIVPKQEIANGGYRFDKSQCPTKYSTDYGKTEISYERTNNGGDVKVIAKDEYDNLDWSKTYSVYV